MQGDELRYHQYDFAPESPIRRAIVLSAAIHAALGLIPDAPGLQPRSGRALLTVSLIGAAERAPDPPRRVPDDPVPEANFPAPFRAVSDRPKAEDSLRASSAPRPVDTRYYPVAEIDVYPRLLVPLPSAIGDTEAQVAQVRISLRIDEYGNVTAARLVESDSVRVAESVLAQVAAARFSPAIRNGRPVRSELFLDVRLGSAPVVDPGR